MIAPSMIKHWDELISMKEAADIVSAMENKTVYTSTTHRWVKGIRRGRYATALDVCYVGGRPFTTRVRLQEFLEECDRLGVRADRGMEYQGF